MPDFVLTKPVVVLDVGETASIGISDSFYTNKWDMISWTNTHDNVATLTIKDEGTAEVSATGPGITRITATYTSASAIAIQKTATAIIKVLPSAPKSLTSSIEFSHCSNPRVELNWQSSEGAAFYKLYRDDKEIGGKITTNSYVDTELTRGGGYTYEVQACVDGSACSDGFITSLKVSNTNIGNTFGSIIGSSKTPKDLTGYDEKTREIFSSYNSDVTLVARYVKVGGVGDGSSSNNAAGSLKTVLGGITNATTNRVYVVLLEEGTYNLAQSATQIPMKNHVAIVGGVKMNQCLSLSDTATILDGAGSYQVFRNDNNDLNNTALLYGVTITNGKDVNGGGMYNKSSSPSLVRVTFSGNTADDNGGGMYNNNSAPSLVKVTFSGNTADDNGGGMYNEKISFPNLVGVTFSGNTATKNGGGIYNESSSPNLVGVTFSGNTANLNGGGIYNTNASPSLVRVTFSGNTANNNGGGIYSESSSLFLNGVTFSGNAANLNGGGMYNHQSSQFLIGVTFSGNTANKNGGGMYNDNHGANTPTIINGIFWSNIAINSGPEFYFSSSSTNQGNLNIYNSIVQGGTGTLVSGKNSNFLNEGGFVAEGGTHNVVITFSNIIDQDPGLEALADNGGLVWTHAIQSGSSAVNQGLYVQRSGSTNYHSINNIDWYIEPDLSGTRSDEPTDAEDFTATDATGHARTGRPDLGAFEAR